MAFKNCYIFLKNTDTKADKQNEKDSGKASKPSIYSCLLKEFPDAEKVSISGEDHFFKKILKLKPSIENTTFDAEVIIFDVKDATYVNVTVEGYDDSSSIECLEKIHSQMEQLQLDDNYIMVISYDAISEYFCNKIFPKPNELERNLRRLLLNTYTINFGRNYFNDIDDKLQEKAKSIIKAKGGTKKKESERLQKFFYSFEFSDIQTLLFTPRWKESDEKQKQEFLSIHSDLSRLSDDELRSRFAEFSNKSEWDRYFADRIKGFDPQEILEKIRKYRNSIAHCKFFYRDDYNNCCSAIDQFNTAIVSAIDITEEKDFLDKNSIALREALSIFVSLIEPFTNTFEDSLFKSAKAMISEFEKIKRNIIPEFPSGLKE